MSTSTASPPSAPPAPPPAATLAAPAPATAPAPPAPSKAARPIGPRLLYWNSGGLPCPARLLADRGDGCIDLVALLPNGQTTAIHMAPHAAGAGSWSHPDEDPGRDGPNGDIARAEGRPIAIGSLVTYWDTRGAEKLALVRSVSLIGFDRKRVVRVDLQRVDGLDSAALESVVAAALDMPNGFDPGRMKTGIDWAGVEFGCRPGRWSWGA